MTPPVITERRDDIFKLSFSPCTLSFIHFSHGTESQMTTTSLSSLSVQSLQHGQRQTHGVGVNSDGIQWMMGCAQWGFRSVGTRTVCLAELHVWRIHPLAYGWQREPQRGREREEKQEHSIKMRSAVSGSVQLNLGRGIGWSESSSCRDFGSWLHLLDIWCFNPLKTRV